MFLTRVIHLEHHIGLQTQALGPAQLSRPHHADLQLPRTLASEAAEAGLYEAALTKRRV